MSSEQIDTTVSEAGEHEMVCVENLSKCYRIFPNKTSRFKQHFFPGKKYYHEFWALRDINLSIRRGEALGVIGLNGAGKSTLLQSIAGTLRPTTGRIRLKGQMAALLELGMGFNDHFTGRENVYFNGSIMGLSRRQMDQRMDDIQSFAGLGDFFDRPVKMYSKGMKARLGFAVAVNMDPEILMVDEILSVGDFRFQQKCLETVQQMRDRMSVIFVSHSMPQVSRFCNRAIVLSKGKVVYEGKPDDAICYYTEAIVTEEDLEKEKREVSFAQKGYQGQLYYDRNRITDVTHRWVDRDGELLETTKNGDEMFLEFSFRLLMPARNLIIGIPIWDNKGNMITALNSDVRNSKITPSKDGFVEGRVMLKHNMLNPGEYSSATAIVDGPQYLYRNLNKDFLVEAMPIYFGFVTPEYEWEFS